MLFVFSSDLLYNNRTVIFLRNYYSKWTLIYTFWVTIITYFYKHLCMHFMHEYKNICAFMYKLRRKEEMEKQYCNFPQTRKNSISAFFPYSLCYCKSSVSIYLFPSLYSHGWPRNHNADQFELDLTEIFLCLFICWVLGL